MISSTGFRDFATIQTIAPNRSVKMDVQITISANITSHALTGFAGILVTVQKRPNQKKERRFERL